MSLNILVEKKHQFVGESVLEIFLDKSRTPCIRGETCFSLLCISFPRATHRKIEMRETFVIIYLKKKKKNYIRRGFDNGECEE